MSEVKKVVLAYSGGLDTSIIIPWLKEHYNNCEVIAVCGNVGQKGELEGLEKRAKASGASSLWLHAKNRLLQVSDHWQEPVYFLEFRHPQTMQVAVGVDCHRLLAYRQ